MKTLIKISNHTISDETIQTVNARELYTFLESKQDFSTWIKNRIEQYGFVENVDYVRFHKKMEANNATIIEYFITLDMAKELSMVERNAKGKAARQYFIDCEKKAKAAVKLASSYSSTGLPEYRKAKAIEMTTKAIGKIFSDLPHLSELSKQAIYANTINPIAGITVIPLPVIAEKTYSATEVGNILGVSSNKIGVIANRLGLKTPEYGHFVLDKARHSDKQVETFRYNQKGIEALSCELSDSR